MSETLTYGDEVELQKRVRVFMDGIDWQHHLEGDSQGTLVFPSVENVKTIRECSAGGECGIVEVEIRLIRWVEPQDLFKNHPEFRSANLPK